MPITAVFFDAGGVLFDPGAATPQWRTLIGEFLVPRLGGTHEAWAEANAWAADRMFARFRDPKGTPNETIPRLRRLWFREMCEKAGVPPPKPREIGAIAEEADRFVSARVVAGLPGIAEPLHALKEIGLRLLTASGHSSLELDGYLRAAGVRDLFDEIYGVDIIDRWKTNAGFYRKILEHSTVQPAEAALVDDQERFLDYAKRAGFARTFLLAPAATASRHDVIWSLAELGARL